MKARFLLAALALVMLGALPAKADQIVGVAGPMTGSEAAFGEQFRHGAEKAVADINAKGGLLGQKLSVFMGDDACDPKQAVNVANDLVEKKVAVVIGHYCSGSSIPASDVYSDAGVIQITPASTNPVYTERGLPSVFRICGRDDAQGPTAAAYLMEHFPGKRIAVVHDRSPYGKGLADQFKKTLNDKGVKEVVYAGVAAGEKDYTPLVSVLKEAKADFVYFGGYKTEAGLIVRQMREQGLGAILVGGDALVTEEFWAITGPAGEGTMMTFGPDARLDPANAELVKSFRAQNYEPEAYTLYTYAAVQAWAQAVQKAGTFDSTKVTAALHGPGFDTVLGKVAFDAKGDNTAPGYVFYQWKGGKYAYVK